LSPADGAWQHDAAEVVAELDTHPTAGLTAAEAARRLQRYGRNELEAEKPLPAWRRFLDQLADPLFTNRMLWGRDRAALASIVLRADELRKLAARSSRPAAAPAGA
jgi:magnesium-transporting ATPase (P-type)